SGPIYRIIDAKQMDVSFTGATLRLIEGIRCAASSDNDSSIHTFVVATPRLAQVLCFSGMRVRVFSAIEQAFEQVNGEIAYRIATQVIPDELSVSTSKQNIQAGQYASA